MFSVFMKTKMQSSWLKQSRGQKGGSKMRAFITVSMVTHSCMDTCSELFGSLTPTQDNTRLSKKGSAMHFYRPQVSLGSCESQNHSHSHHLALQHKAEEFGIVIPKSTLMHFWDQIFPKSNTLAVCSGD